MFPSDDKYFLPSLQCKRLSFFFPVIEFLYHSSCVSIKSLFLSLHMFSAIHHSIKNSLFLHLVVHCIIFNYASFLLLTATLHSSSYINSFFSRLISNYFFSNPSNIVCLGVHPTFSSASIFVGLQFSLHYFRHISSSLFSFWMLYFFAFIADFFLAFTVLSLGFAPAR